MYLMWALLDSGDGVGGLCVGVECLVAEDTVYRFIGKCITHHIPENMIELVNISQIHQFPFQKHNILCHLH